MADDDMWGNDDDEDDSIFVQIQEADYNDYGFEDLMLVGNSNNGSSNLFNSEEEVLNPVTAHLHNTSELRAEKATLQRKLEEAVKMNTELKDKNYSLQGETATLRRVLEQHNLTKQQQIFDKIQGIQDSKQKEGEERRKLLAEIEALKSQLHVSRVEVTTLEEKNQQLTRRNSLNKTMSNPALGTTLMGTTGLGISQSFSLTQAPQTSQYFHQNSRNDKNSFRASFFASEVYSQAPVGSTIPTIETESKEIQTDDLLPAAHIVEPSPQASSVCEDDGEDLDTVKFSCFDHLYAEIKTSIRRLITVEIQMLKPMIDKTLRDVPSGLKRRVAPRKTRFGLGFEAFDATALLLQWLDEQEMERFEEATDMQAEYFKRMEEIYDSTKKDRLRYPPSSAEIDVHSENWPDSELVVDLTGSDEDLMDYSASATATAQLGQSAMTGSLNHEFQAVQTQVEVRRLSNDSDTSEDEYDLGSQFLATPAPLSADFEVVAAGTQQSQTQFTEGEKNCNKVDRKPLTFFKEYKLKSKLQTNRNCYKYLKNGQPLEVVSQILDGLYEEGPGIWNTLLFVKNELRFILQAKELFEPNRFHVFMTLLVWAKNLWSVVASVESEERPKLPKDWDTELFGWTDLIILVVWRPSRNLIAFCRELRSIFLQIILHVIQSGYFETEKENYRRLFLTIHDSIKNPTHHSLLNAQLLLDILNILPRIHTLPFYCKNTIPLEIVLPRCLLLELSNRISDEYTCNPSVNLFDAYLDLLDRLGNRQMEFQVISKKCAKKRKLPNNEAEGNVEMLSNSISPSMNSVLQLSPPNIFKKTDTEKCACHVATVSNFLLMLNKTFALWHEKFRDAEFESLLQKNKGKVLNTRNIYTDVLVRAFEFLYILYKHSDNLGNSYNCDVSTYFWSIVGSYRRHRKHFPFRPDMEAMLLHMTSDCDDKRKAGDGGVTFPPAFDEEWLKLVTQFPELKIPKV